MRPKGPIRQMALTALTKLHRERQAQQRRGATWRDAAQRLAPQGVSAAAVKATLKNMAKAGEITPVDSVRVPGVSKPLTAWAPAASSAQRAGDGAGMLQRVAMAWAGR